MGMEVPYVVFEVWKKDRGRGTYAIDAYFTEFVSLTPRKVTLVRDARSLRAVKATNPLPVLLGRPVEELLKELYMVLQGASIEAREKRVGHMRRWNVWRILGIPTGHGRHIAIDEELAKVERENTLGLALLGKILGVKGESELTEVRVREKGVVYRRLWLEGGEVVGDGGTDKVYTNLLRMDPTFRTAFYSAILGKIALTEEIRKGAQAFAYSQQAT
ncbi:hypothetical protein [Thermococcus henrietii]|uniref:hypothetical protein n=1 Tax=Thermococcus henrietii TaxID=2016361 RepID=UPI0011AB8C99|nr:hypothetical protein [Thermococcus henrietii]